MNHASNPIPPPAGSPAVDVAPTATSGDTDARLAELGRMQALVVSTAAHELRTPLTVLRVHADLLLEASGELGPDERRSLEAIARAVVRLQDVSEHLVAELRETAGGAEDALRRWLVLEQGSTRTRPLTA
ncbi:histidine kinase dimerization/phospho-acceptor domain-containing protein [Patulibacter sp.]|uniref:histidine kinase dimerization/phospho-acceptor domain-containing protein n=1 Tax=Patulibacter sp. TaxID=1912859 RepID=UPI002723CE68|nr:histidine kinase dimerization/phospho-acceptor domain-containing protein [Patulibacter sp.]MDO9410393.1 histidine kinase dimerization/phospho-acceptor domain-containing protein [Patulibacter sp.]